MRTLIAFMCAMCMIGSLSISADATNKRMTEEELRQAYLSDPQFQMHYYANPAEAMAMLDSIVEDYFTPIPTQLLSRRSGDIASVYPTLVKQLNNFTCGPASVYMAIDGWNGTGSVAGSTTTAKLQTLANNMGSTETQGTLVYNMWNELKKYTPSEQYSYYLGSTLTEQEFRVYVFNSLSYGRAPILHAKTSSLSYYSGYNTGHYIPITQMDYGTMQVRLHDPNNNSQYYGIHYVDYLDAYKAITKESGRYLLCYWP